MIDEIYEPISRTVCIKLPDALYVAAKQASKKQDMLFGAWMRQAVANALACQCSKGGCSDDK